MTAVACAISSWKKMKANSWTPNTGKFNTDIVSAPRFSLEVLNKKGIDDTPHKTIKA
jgi:hypothetical protein